jgi:ribonuclease E
MTKRMLIDASHAEETRVVVLDGTRLEDFDLEAANRLPLKGNIYLAKVVRVEPSLQAAFVEYGGNRHGFLPLAEIHPDYYQIPVADRQRLLEMQAAEAREEDAAEEAEAASDRREAAPGARRDRDRGRSGGRRDRRDGPPGSDPDGDAERGSGEAPADRAEPEPVLVAPPPLDAAEDAPSASDPTLLTAGEAPTDGGESAAPGFAESHPPAAAATPDEAAASPDDATIAEQSGPILLPGEGDQPSLTRSSGEASGDGRPSHEASHGDSTGNESTGNESTGDAPSGDAPFGGAPVAAERSRSSNGHADDADGFEHDDQPPPEDIGGEAPEEMARERRGAARFMRQYKIQEVIKRRQIMLVQVVKEERGTKGAALTTYVSLAGRFSVLMPNSPRGGGVSRKITSATDRRRLREVIDELELPDGMSLIVRTAGAQRPKPEIRRDCEYLLRLWDSIRERTLASAAPALIYEEADLIKRSIRDNYARDVEEILVDGEEAYQAAREFMRMLMPQHAQKIQFHRDGGLFARHGVEAQLDAMHSPVVQLKSGGYVVINQTEALVAIDVNSGRSTRERHIEDTAFRTNVEAADEIARQLRLRDLAGLIVIDFIDMESNRHDATVERRLKEALRHDRARIQVGRISHFGLLEMSRQRLRPSLAETTFVACPACSGVGQVRSIESSALSVMRAIEEEGAKRRAAEIAVHVASPVALYLLNRKRDRLARIEQRFGMAVLFEPDDTLAPPALRIDRLRVADPNRERPAESMPSALRMDYAPEPEDDEDEAAQAPAEARGNGHAAAQDEGSAEDRSEEGRRRRRRRRRRGGRSDEMDSAAGTEGSDDEGDSGGDAEAGPDRPSSAPPLLAADAAEVGAEDAPRGGDASAEEPAGDQPRGRRRRRRGGRRSGAPGSAQAGGQGSAYAPADEDGAADAGGLTGTPLPSPRLTPEPAPRYSGPTPADPFAGHVDDIMAAMEAAEAAAEAAAHAAATLAGRRGRMAPPPQAAVEAPGPAEPSASGSEQPAAPAPEADPIADTGPTTDAAVPLPNVDAAPVAAADSPEAPPEPVAAAAPPEPAPDPASTPLETAQAVQGPVVQPRSVDEVAADAPRRSGWWRR